MLYIFDMGGVLVHDIFELGEILKEQNWEGDLRALYTDDLMEELSAGTMDEAAYWDAFNRAHGTAVAADRWGQTFRPRRDEEMAAFIEELAKKHRVVCGTNTFASHYRINRERQDYSCFHKVYASHLMGTAKPNPRFWQVILEEEGFAPEETVFIDDFDENTRVAASLGIKTVTYRDLPSLQEALSRTV